MISFCICIGDIACMHIQLHLANLIPRRFLKPAVCKYPTTVNSSEIYILLPKPCPWMWHLICGNCVRNGSDRKPKTGKTHSLKLALLKIPIGAVLYYHADMHVFSKSAQRTTIRQTVSATHKRCAHHPCHHWFHSAVLYCTLSIGTFKSATFGECIWRFSVLLSRPFLTQFLRTRCHIQGQGYGNKMFISDLFTVVGYLHTAGFRNRRGINFAKCIW